MKHILPALALTSLFVACGDPSSAALEGAEASKAQPAEGQPPATPTAEAEGPHVMGTIDLSEVPEGAASRGLDLTMDTHRLLPDNVGDGLNCTNCHLAGGTTPKAAPWVGVTDRYPRYRARSGKEDDLQDRVNGCFERSMNGTALERDSEDMLAMVAYMEWLSEGVPDGKQVVDMGMPRLEPPSTPDPANGKALYDLKCASCHQVDGSGMFAPDGKTMFPPLWGERSYNIGAGMARLDTAAAFVKWNMPLGQGGSLTDQEAYDIASYFTVRERPDFAKKDQDWPDGGKPEDARY